MSRAVDLIVEQCQRLAQPSVEFRTHAESLDGSVTLDGGVDMGLVLEAPVGPFVRATVTTRGDTAEVEVVSLYCAPMTALRIMDLSAEFGTGVEIPARFHSEPAVRFSSDSTLPGTSCEIIARYSVDKSSGSDRRVSWLSIRRNDPTE